MRELWRTAISEGGDTGMLVAADAFSESENPLDQTMSELLRTYVEIQTYVRMSSPVPTELTDKFNRLNSEFGFVNFDANRWSNRLGYYYLSLDTEMRRINDNFNLLSMNPIRTLIIRNCVAGTELEQIVSNYRMSTVEDLTLRFMYSQRGINIEYIKKLNGESLRTLRIFGMRDNALNLIKGLIKINKKIAKGCKLITDNNLNTR